MGEATAVGMEVRALDTPALVIDLDVLEENIARMAEVFRRHDVAWRPHTKSIKTPAIAHLLLRAGARGVTCAKLGEAEVMAAAGITDILVANQIVTPLKITRLVNLLRHAEVVVAVDSRDNVAALDAAAQAKGVRAPVVIEIDIGMGRAGVAPGEGAVAFAREIAARPGLRFAGLMTWESRAAFVKDPAEKRRTVETMLAPFLATAEACRAAGLPCAIVSCGGTCTYPATASCRGVTEVQAGGGIFGDVYYRESYGIAHRCALTVLSSVTSRPNPTRIVCDAGKKTMTGDTAMPRPLGLGEVKSVRLSAEHATIELAAPDTTLRVADTIAFEIGYSETSLALHDWFYAARGGRIEAVWPILGRGRLQ